MAIPYINPQDLGDPNQFKLFAANTQTFKELLMAQRYDQAVELGTQLQEDLDANPGWAKYFSIKRELGEAAVILKIEEGKRIVIDLKTAKRNKNIAVMQTLIEQLSAIQDYLNAAHYFTDSFFKTLSDYQKWYSEQLQKENRQNNKKLNPKENQIEIEEANPEIKDETLEIKDANPEAEENENSEIVDDSNDPPDFLDSPTTKKMIIPPNFFIPPVTAEHELDPDFANSITTEIKTHLPHFKIITVKNPKTPLFGRFKYYGVYFNPHPQICTICLIQPVSLLGKVVIKNRINYEPNTGASDEAIKKELQTQILAPYTNYKDVCLQLEDGEFEQFNGILEQELNRNFRKLHIFPTANSFTIEYQNLRYALDLRAYFVLRGDLEYDGNSQLPGIPSIKMHFVPPNQRDHWYQTLPQPPNEKDNSLQSLSVTKKIGSPNKTPAKIDRLGDYCRFGLFLCGIMLILAYYFNSVPIFWCAMLIFLIILGIYSIGKGIYIRKYHQSMTTPSAGVITTLKTSKSTHNGLNPNKKINEMNNLIPFTQVKESTFTKVPTPAADVEFGNQKVADFLS